MIISIPDTIEELQKEITKHNILYYVDGNPIISDSEYNEMYKRLIELEKENPQYITSTSPTQLVGMLGNDGTINHRYPMYSLDNLYNEAEIKEWLSKLNGETSIFFDLKHDGLSTELIYIDGLFRSASKRGDGQRGDDVTKHVMYIPSVPKKLEDINCAIVSIMGEFTISSSSLLKINEYLKSINRKVYANTRNGVAGILGSNIPDPELLKYVEFDIHGSEDLCIDCITFKQFMDRAEKAGFKIREHGVANAIDTDTIISFYHNYERLYENYASDHPIDGVVLKINDLEQWPTLGFTKKYPRFAKACKFREKIITTTILKIDYNIGKTGALTPVAKIIPVQVGGVVVSSINLFNKERILERNTLIGAIVGVYRAGGVVPGIKEVINIDDALPYEEPIHCPYCKSKLSNTDTRLMCINVHCNGTIVSRLAYAASRDVLNIKGLSHMSLVELVFNHGITSLAKLIKVPFETLAFVMGQKNAQKILDQLNVIRRRLSKDTPDLYDIWIRLLLGLSIPNLTNHNINYLFLHGTPNRQHIWKSIPSILIDTTVMQEKGISESSALDILDNAVQRLDEIYELIEL